MKTKYLLITPAHNEEKNIRHALDSVVAQTIHPTKWVIVDDGSTDRTSEIIKEYERLHNFITYYHLDRERIKTYYARRIWVILAGIDTIKHLEYDFIAVLDADISLPPTYYENILCEFDRNSKLGIASGIYTNCIKGQLQKVVRDDDNISTPGGLQVFRRECYESIGGHVPLLYGGSDVLVGILARMNGWQTRAFREFETIHYRPVGVWGGSNILRARFRQGMQEYDLGTHPLFMLAKSTRRIFLERPYFFCGMMRLSGFLYLSLRRAKRSITADALKYVRSEQIKRTISFLQGGLSCFKLVSETRVISSTDAEILSPADKDLVLISPVYNEEAFMDQLIQSVVSQTVRPKKWIIVDDGSTDGTQAVVKKYEKQYDFIVYHRLKRSDVKSYYYSKTKAFKAGYDSIKHLDHSFVACLDADLTLPPTYYEDILREFNRNPKLGIASGVYVNKVDNRLQKVVRDNRSTPGGLQVFRSKCYESIGGYTPTLYGGEDALADVLARMRGWETRSFSDYQAIHHRLIGVRGGTSALRGKLIQGLAEYYLWTHPVFMLAKSLRRAFLEKPYVFGSMARLFGYLYGYLKREKRDIHKDVKKYVRKEQMRRLFLRAT